MQVLVQDPSGVFARTAIVYGSSQSPSATRTLEQGTSSGSFTCSMDDEDDEREGLRPSWIVDPQPRMCDQVFRKGTLISMGKTSGVFTKAVQIALQEESLETTGVRWASSPDSDPVDWSEPSPSPPPRILSLSPGPVDKPRRATNPMKLR
jgi:hypothetical protein